MAQAEAASAPACEDAVVDEGEGAVPVLAGKLGADRLSQPSPPMRTGGQQNP